MRAWLGAAAWLISAAFAHAEPRIEIKGLAGQVTVIPERRADIAVGFVKRSRLVEARIRRSGDRTVIEGGLEHRIKGCPHVDGEDRIRVSGLGTISRKNLPSLVIRTPLSVRLVVGDGVAGVVGRSTSLDLENHGCGGWTVANVSGRARLSQIGSGSITAGRAGASDLSVAGGGEIAVRSVEGTLTAVSTGEGSIRVATVDGPVIARIAGSGDITVEGGGAPELNAQVAGSGAMRFGGSAGPVTASVAGEGEVVVARSSGPITRRIFGAGRIRVGP